MSMIESERLYTRYYTIDDLDNFFRLNGSEDVMHYIRPVKSWEECEVFLREIIGKYYPGSLDLRVALLEKGTDAFVGSFAIIPVDNSKDTQLGYALLKDFRGRGYATEIVKASLHYIYTVLKLPEIVAITRIENTASQRVLLKNGFLFEKKFREEPHDLNLYRHHP